MSPGMNPNTARAIILLTVVAGVAVIGTLAGWQTAVVYTAGIVQGLLMALVLFAREDR